MVCLNATESIKTRYSVRDYQKKDVPDGLIEEILNAAICAPSAGNVQDWHFVVVKNPETRDKLAATSMGQVMLSDAPAVICVCSDLKKINDAYGERGKALYSVQDTAAATMCLMLAAWDKGLGTCWVGAFNEQEVKNILVLPTNIRPLAIVTMGYPKTMDIRPKSRYLKSSLHKEHW